MRDKRDRYWCAIADTLGIRPWEIDDMDVNDFHAACDYIDRLNREAERES